MEFHRESPDPSSPHDGDNEPPSIDNGELVHDADVGLATAGEGVHPFSADSAAMFPVTAAPPAARQRRRSEYRSRRQRWYDCSHE